VTIRNHYTRNACGRCFDSDGGLMYLSYGIFEGKHVTFEGEGTDYWDSAVYVREGSFTCTDCAINNNNARIAGALFNRQGTFVSAPLRFLFSGLLSHVHMAEPRQRHVLRQHGWHIHLWRTWSD
jgi:hypothetical protein